MSYLNCLIEITKWYLCSEINEMELDCLLNYLESIGLDIQGIRNFLYSDNYIISDINDIPKHFNNNTKLNPEYFVRFLSENTIMAVECEIGE